MYPITQFYFSGVIKINEFSSHLVGRILKISDNIYIFLLEFYAHIDILTCHNP